jgi:exopolysaccharide production protein ExoY
MRPTLLAAALALALLSPLFLVLCVLIRTEGKGPALFTQTRVGRGGVEFTLYKFRTMVHGADEMLRQYLANNPQAAEEWRRTRKLKDDPRVTLLGHVLRKSSLDELPQLINVLRGDMSCVGPRPVVPEELQEYGAHSEEYLKARPGMTGIWQVSGINRLGYAHRVDLDTSYIRNWSVWRDLIILIKTVFVMLNFDEAS